MIRRLALAVAALSLMAAAASAGTLTDPLAAGFQPRSAADALGSRPPAMPSGMIAKNQLGSRVTTT